uniref:Uncharacterized protein n=1 Tax=Mycena chlorophos TaxID=658473 RepID=A0ABQ0KXY3_MYCCL|nr:predicted protein [Mycena chlorophos]
MQGETLLAVEAWKPIQSLSPPPAILRNRVFGYMLLPEINKHDDSHHRLFGVLYHSELRAQYAEYTSLATSSLIVWLAFFDSKANEVFSVLDGDDKIPNDARLREMERQIGVLGPPEWIVDNGSVFKTDASVEAYKRNWKPYPREYRFLRFEFSPAPYLSGYSLPPSALSPIPPPPDTYQVYLYGYKVPHATEKLNERIYLSPMRRAYAEMSVQALGTVVFVAVYSPTLQRAMGVATGPGPEKMPLKRSRTVR